jgi:hypothetical protein
VKDVLTVLRVTSREVLELVEGKKVNERKEKRGDKPTSILPSDGQCAGGSFFSTCASSTGTSSPLYWRIRWTELSDNSFLLTARTT